MKELLTHEGVCNIDEQSGKIYIKGEYNIFLLEDPVVNFIKEKKDDMYIISIDTKYTNPLDTIIYFDGQCMYIYTSNSIENNPVRKMEGRCKAIMEYSVSQKLVTHNGSHYRLLEL